MKLIVTSSKDPAGRNMYMMFREEFGFKEDGSYGKHKRCKKGDFVLVMIDQDLLKSEDLNNDFSPELYIFASKHKSEKARPSLTVHCTGNWSKAEYGGGDKELADNPACHLKKALNSLEPVEGFEITLEATHHGPTDMNAPVVFVEVGSSEKEWDNLEACRSVCKAILALDDVERCESFVGFGGPHYAPSFTRMALETGYAPGHICPKYRMGDISEKIVLEAFAKTTPKPSFAVLDWKGMDSGQRLRLLEILEKHNIAWKKTKEIIKAHNQQDL